MSKPLNGVMRFIIGGTRKMTLATCRAFLIGTVLVGSALVVPAPAYAAKKHAQAPAPIAPASASELSQPELFGAVTSRAKLLAQNEFKPFTVIMPEALLNMDYDQYRSIRFRPDAALWRNESLFELQLFHAGFLFREPVILHMATLGKDTTVQFKQEYFNYDATAAPLAGIAPKDIGFAGFRVHYPLNNPQYKDEFLVFQGASYFRIVGPGQAYGISARGLAVDCAESKGEEFPIFREFWMVKPTPEEKHLVMYALMDSKSITGAYRFDIYPGSPTEVAIQAHLFARKDIIKVGIAPLTSMFLFGENSVHHYDDFRPEVHDSDGLAMLTSAGEWIWRPLTNHRNLHVTSLGDTNPQGFGIIQRDRDFNNFLDTEAKYERRPSLWVKPEGGWGKGRVELVEIPSDSEANDNVVAYWVPDQPMKAGDARDFNYRLRSFDSELPEQTVGKVLRTRTGWGAVAVQRDPPPKSKRQFAIDFRGGELAKLPNDAVLQAVMEKNSGNVTDLAVNRLPDGKTFRASFKLEPEGNKPVDMRLVVKLRDKPVTEVWSYVWYPDAIQ